MLVSDYLLLSSKDIRRQPVRSTLTILALAISTVILVTLVAVSLGARSVIIKELGLSSSLSSIVVTPNQNSGIGLLGGNVQVTNDATAKLDDSIVSQVQSIPHVVSVSPRVGLYELKKFSIEGNPKQFVAQATGIVASNPHLLPLSSGTFFSSSDATNEVILGKAYATALGLNDSTSLIGKTVTITTIPGYRGDGAVIPGPRSTAAQYEDFNQTPTTLTAKIVGVTDAGSNDNQLFVTMVWARKIKTMQTYNSAGVLTYTDQIAKDGYSNILLDVDKISNVRAVSASLEKHGFSYIATQQQIDRINSLTTIMWGVLGAISLVSLVTACLGIVNTILMTISEQKYAIGVWRAFGARRYSIAIRFLLQASMLGLLGGVLGSGIGVFISKVINRHVGALLSAQHLAPVDVITISPKLIIASIIVTMLFGAVSGLYPSLRAARVDPSEALNS